MVVAIIGILAAVAIPVYNNYRINAAQGAITSSLQNIGKGFAACLTLNPFSRCDTLQKIAVDCPTCGMAMSTSSSVPLCVDAETRVGGQAWRGCVETSGGVPLVVGNWPFPCKNVTITYPCTGTTLGPTSNTCSSLGCTAMTAAPTTCSASTPVTHNCQTANPDDLTNGSAFDGICGANGTCS